jgi:hypothetical protein
MAQLAILNWQQWNARPSLARIEPKIAKGCWEENQDSALPTTNPLNEDAGILAQLCPKPQISSNFH